MTNEERSLLLDTMLRFRELCRWDSGYIENQTVYYNQETYYRMMDIITLISLGIKDEYKIPGIEEYYYELHADCDTDYNVGHFHENLIKKELKKLGWNFLMEEVYLDFDDTSDLTDRIAVSDWERVIKNELWYLPEHQLDMVCDTLKTFHEPYDEEKMEFNDIDYHFAYIILEGPCIPDNISEETKRKLYNLIFSLSDIHNYSYGISWSCQTGSIQTCIIIIGDSYTENVRFESSSGYY